MQAQVNDCPDSIEWLLLTAQCTAASVPLQHSPLASKTVSVCRTLPSRCRQPSRHPAAWHCFVGMGGCTCRPWALAGWRRCCAVKHTLYVCRVTATSMLAKTGCACVWRILGSRSDVPVCDTQAHAVLPWPGLTGVHQALHNCTHHGRRQPRGLFWCPCARVARANPSNLGMAWTRSAAMLHLQCNNVTVQDVCKDAIEREKTQSCPAPTAILWLCWPCKRLQMV